MNESFYTARATLEAVGHLHRRARLESGATIEMGVHEPVVTLFGLKPERELPLPVDYVVAAAGGCMLGTLLGALEVRQIPMDREDVGCEAEGRHEVRDGLPILTEVHVRYRLRIPAGSREKVDRALARHQERCPTARSLAGSVKVGWSAEVEERA